jgi:hypothetical protein
MFEDETLDDSSLDDVMSMEDDMDDEEDGSGTDDEE